MVDIFMPALSPTMEEGTLARWMVKVGDKVKPGDIIAEIETDKATMEVEAVDEGVVLEILVAAGAENVKVNSKIAVLSEEDGAATPKVSPDIVPALPEPKVTSIATAKADAAPPSPPSAFPTMPTPGFAASRHNEARIFASPLAKRLAAQKGIDLKSLKGSGPHGRIISKDVEEAKTVAASLTDTGTQPGPSSIVPNLAALEAAGIAKGSYDLVPLDGMRKTIAKRLTDSFRDIPHFPLSLDLDIDTLLEARQKINDHLSGRDIRISVNDFLIKASAMALKSVPEANASYSSEGLVFHHHADIAVAVAIEGGLITPILRKSETLSLAEISKTMKDLAERARGRKLKPEEFQGGTFSISNLGMFGIKSFSSILNPPHGAILSIGAGEKRPVVKDDSIVIATVMTVTLTCDHRVVDGSIGAKFLTAFKGFVENPITLLAG